MPAFIFNDARAFQNPEGNSKFIKIGLLVTDNKSLAAKQGAEMAIREANKKGGLNGVFFKLIVRSMEGPWGTGSKQAVNLIFEERVVAIMGSHDGRNAHLVEQATTKARIVFLSAWAGDPTLSQAFVPWYFSCVPNNNQQAKELIEEIYNIKKNSKVAALSDNSYDSEFALNSFVKMTEMAGKPNPVQFYYNDSDKNFDDLIDHLNKEDVNCVILFGQSKASMSIINEMRQRKMNQQIFGALSVLGEDKYSEPDINNYENVVLVTTGDWLTSEGSAFRQEYQRLYGKIPGAVAAYAYDGMNVIINAIKNTGSDPDLLQKSMTKTHYNGITGLIQFDEKGNRIGNAGLIQIKNGIPVPVQR